MTAAICRSSPPALVRLLRDEPAREADEVAEWSVWHIKSIGSNRVSHKEIIDPAVSAGNAKADSGEASTLYFGRLLARGWVNRVKRESRRAALSPPPLLASAQMRLSNCGPPRPLPCGSPTLCRCLRSRPPPGWRDCGFERLHRFFGLLDVIFERHFGAIEYQRIESRPRSLYRRMQRVLVIGIWEQRKTELLTFKSGPRP
jgi:hypothetical protein